MFKTITDSPVQNLKDVYKQYPECMLIMEMLDPFSEEGKVLAVNDDFNTHKELYEHYMRLCQSSSGVYCVVGHYPIQGDLLLLPDVDLSRF